MVICALILLENEVFRRSLRDSGKVTDEAFDEAEKRIIPSTAEYERPYQDAVYNHQNMIHNR